MGAVDGRRPGPGRMVRAPAAAGRQPGARRGSSRGPWSTSTCAMRCRASACPRWSCTGRRSSCGTCATRCYLAEHIPGARYVELEGIDSFPFVGDSDAIVEEIEEFLTGGRGGGELARALLTVMFTDIVDATARAAELGDGRWRDLLARHEEEVRKELARFDGPRGQDRSATASWRPSTGRPRERCAVRWRSTAPRGELGVEVRIGVHTGECELIGEDVGGMAVHIASRVNGLAGRRRGARVGHRARDGRRRPVRLRGPRLSRAQGRSRPLAAVRARRLGTMSAGRSLDARRVPSSLGRRGWRVGREYALSHSRASGTCAGSMLWPTSDSW